jgi:hypothetical protein
MLLGSRGDGLFADHRPSVRPLLNLSSAMFLCQKSSEIFPSNLSKQAWERAFRLIVAATWSTIAARMLRPGLVLAAISPGKRLTTSPEENPQ